jgi:hypothetical protein
MMFRLFWLCLVLGAQALALTGCASSLPWIAVRDSRVVGDELRMNAVIYVQHQIDTRGYETDFSSYYVVVDLASKAPLAERARVVGPLYRDPENQSSIWG